MSARGRPFDPGSLRRTPKEEWKRTRYGLCQNCGNRDRLWGHHVVLEQIVARCGGELYDPRNRMDLCTDCHQAHHHPGVEDTKIPFAKVPAAAVEFAKELMGVGPAINYFARRYRAADPPGGWPPGTEPEERDP